MDSKSGERCMLSIVVEGDGEQTIERLHAIHLGNDQCILDNSPFYAFDVSWADTVLAPVRNGERTMVRVLERGGHSTYRVRLPFGVNHETFLAAWKPLEALGCSFEGSSTQPRRLYAIDVPPGVSVHDVYAELELGEQKGLWEFEEAHYAAKA